MTRAAGAQHGLELLGRHRAREVVALPFGAAPGREQVQLPLRLDTFGGDRHAELAREPDGGLHDGGVARALQLFDEIARDLHAVDGEAPQVIERGVPGAEIIDGQPYAECTQLREQPRGPVACAHEHRLGELELEAARIETAVAQRRADRLFEVERRAQLRRRQVHRDVPRQEPRIYPGAGLPARLAQHHAAERHDEPAALGLRDEFPGGENAALRVAPACQRLDAGDAPGHELDLRLVHDEQLARLDRAAQLRDQRDARPDPGVHRFVEEAVGTAPLGLGAVQGHVGVRQDRLERSPATACRRRCQRWS